MQPGCPPSLRAPRALAALLALALSLSAACSGDVESRLAEIRSMQEAGEFESSIEPLRGLVTTHSTHPEVNFRLGLALVRTGRPSLAIWPLQKAVDSQEHGLAAGLLLISALLQTGDPEEAVRAADRILERDPNNTMALYSRGRANINASQFEEALIDSDRLLALDADDTRALVLRSAALAELDRTDEAEAVQSRLETIAEKAGDRAQAARACASRGVLFSMTERPEEATAAFKTCIERYPSDDVVRSQATDHFVGQQDFASAAALWQAAVEETPEDGALRVKLADLLRRDGRTEEAEAVLDEMVELFDSAGAWRAMASFRRTAGDMSGAREALEQAIERTAGDTAALRFELAELLIEEGNLDRARQITEELNEPAYSHLLRGSIALAENDPKAALEAYEAGLRRWPNNAGARFLAGSAAEQLGDMPRAIAEYREAVRNDPSRSDAALRLAQIHYSKAEYAPAADFVDKHLTSRPFSGPAPYLLAAQIATARGDTERARKHLEELLSRPGYEEVALVALAEAARRDLGADATIAAIERAGASHPEALRSASVQRAIVGLLTQAGRGDEALARARKQLAAAPDDALAHDLVGRVLLQQSKVDEAAREFERAVELADDEAAPHEGLGFVALARGDLKQAIAEFDRAAALDPHSGEYDYRAAQALLASGDRDGAIAKLHDAIEAEPAHLGAANDLAWLLAETGGDLELALELARRAVRVAPSGATHDTLGWVHLKRGDGDLAEAAFRQVIADQGESGTLLYHLGLAQAAQGETADAIETLRKAVAADAFPESAAASAELARLEQP